MDNPKETETELETPGFVDCGKPFLDDKEDEITVAKSIMDEIIEKTENEEERPERSGL